VNNYQPVVFELLNDNAGAPGSTVLATNTWAAAAFVSVTGVTFGTPVKLENGVSYWVCLRSTRDSSSNHDPFVYVSTANPYAGGTFYTSVNGSAPYTLVQQSTYDLYCSFILKTEVGKVYKTDSATANLTTPFIGFSKVSGVRGASAEIALVGIITGLSGLTPGTVYYVSPTKGAIASSAGANVKKVGIAITSSTLLLLVTV
jgi:hypothetical protein